MPRAHLTPNPENASLPDPHAVQRAGNKETHRRCLVIILLLTGSPREQVMKVVDISESGVKKIVRAFNSYGWTVWWQREERDGSVSSEENRKKRY